MNPTEFILHHDAAIKLLEADNDGINNRLEKAINMLKMVKDDLDNIYVRLDKLEGK